ncbi:MAG: radical SAM protein [Chloroflexota bacterium]|nr:radical SAM protein [Chloroflexota bacterium]
MNIAFGPVPSRRLGRSLGINNIPPKICSYACVYCQLGRTLTMSVDRQAFYKQEKVIRAVRDKVAKARASDEAVDYLTFVPDGEPTLDLNLAAEISALRELDIPIAVISNASLIWREDVRDDLMGADWVSLKVDAVREPSWRRINRPHGSLDLHKILGGIRTFSGVFEGELATETMLVKGVNNDEANLRETARFLGEIQPKVAYLAIPTRPPAEEWVRPAQEDQIHQAYRLFKEQVDQVELLLGYEGNAFASTGDAEQDLLSITAVHPMREDAVEQLLEKAGSNWGLVENLLRQDKLVELQYDGRHFYLRRIAMPKAQRE